MIQRYTHPEMGAIWSDQRRYETWLEVELAAADAMAEAGLDSARGRAPSCAPRRTFDIAAHRGDRSGHPARRDRLHHGRRREGRAGGALAALRPHLLRRHRHGAGAADARGLRPHRQEHRRPDGGGPRARRRAPAHADDRPHARRARRADDVRPEARAVVRRARSATSIACCARATIVSVGKISGRGRARSRTSIRRSRRASASGSGSSRRRCRRR